MISAVAMMESRVSCQGTRTGQTPRTALQSIRLQPISFTIARKIVVPHHYLHSLPGGTKLACGVFLNHNLLGAITFGAGPQNTFRLVKGAASDDCLTLTRFWLSDQLPPNAESRVIGLALKALRRFTHVKFIVTYADPAQEHVGIIYQATNWLYTGLSKTAPLYDIGDGKPKHSRSLGQIYGTHSIKYLVRPGSAG